MVEQSSVNNRENKEKADPGKILILGGPSGLIASSFIEFSCWSISSPSRIEADITNKQQMEECIRNYDGNTILLLGAYTDVRGAEKDSETALKVNRDGTRIVAETAKKYGKHLITISTDYVFEGTDDNPGPYSEAAEIADVNSRKIGEYARSKNWAERVLREVGGRYSIIRIGFPFGNRSSPKDLINKTISFIEKGYNLYADQRYTPTYIPDLIRVIHIISRRQLTGVFHVATHPPTTPYEFGKYIAELTDRDSEAIGEGSMEEYLSNPSNLRVSLRGGLKTQQTEKKLGIKFKNWKAAVREQLII